MNLRYYVACIFVIIAPKPFFSSSLRKIIIDFDNTDKDQGEEKPQQCTTFVSELYKLIQKNQHI